MCDLNILYFFYNNINMFVLYGWRKKLIIFGKFLLIYLVVVFLSFISKIECFMNIYDCS